jgi:hypothetical protein
VVVDEFVYRATGSSSNVFEMMTATAHSVEALSWSRSSITDPTYKRQDVGSGPKRKENRDLDFGFQTSLLPL